MTRPTVRQLCGDICDGETKILLCWARIAAAYHYPSDLIAGIGIGVAVGVPLARILL